MPKAAVFTYYNKHYQLLQEGSRSFFLLTRNNKAGVSGARGLDIVYNPPAELSSAQFLMKHKKTESQSELSRTKSGTDTGEKTDKFMAKNKSTANDIFC